MKKLLLFTFALFLWTGAWADKTVYLEPNKWYTGEGNEAFSVWVCDAADASTNPNQFVAMTPVDGTSYYQAVFSDAYTKIVFVRHSTSGPADWTDNKWNQTDDITTFADKSLFTITYWHSGSDSGDSNSSYSYNGDAHTLYSATFATGLDWTNVYAYAWNGSTHCIGEWPGKKMTATSETFTIDGVAETIYSISFLSTVTPSNILFNMGENGAIGVNQTADLTFTDDKFYFLPTANPIDPTDLAARVSVIFSDYYNRNLTDPNNGWGGGPNPKFSSIEYPVIKDGHKVVHVIGTAVNGRTTTQLNSQYSDFHVKLWPKTATKFKIWDDNKYSSATTYSGTLIPGQWNDVTIEGVSFTTAYIGIELFDGDTPETEFFLDHFYFAKPSVVDNTPPTLSVCSLKSTNCVSATLRLQATDNLSETVYYKITNTANSTVWQTTGASGAEIEYVVGGLSADTEYNFSVVAMDENENSSDPQLINATTSDYPAIPVPNKKEADVKTLYGYYGSATGLNKTSGTDFEMLGKTVVKYKNNNAQFSLPADPEFDASDMDYIHFDILSDVDTPTALFVENRTENWKGKDVDGGLAAGVWTSFDVPVSFFITECGQTMTRVINFALIKAVSNKSGHDGFNDFSSPYPTLYIANAYLWKEAASDVVKPVMVSAALASKTHNSATLTLEATDNNSKVKFHIVDATNNINVTTGLASQGADFEYTVTGLTAETAYNFTVTAEDDAGNVSENYIVMDGFTTNAAPADIPSNLPNNPAHLGSNVKSVFGNYGKKAGIGYANGAGEQTIISENDVIKFTNGVPYIHNIGLNVSDMDYLHLDVWTYPTTTMAVFVQDGVKMIAPDEQTVETGEWKSIDIPLTFFTDNGMDLKNVTIIQFGKTVGDKTNHVGMSNFDDDNNAYIANIYFYKAETVNVADASGLATYVSTSDLNYGAVDGLKAYKANVNVSAGTLEFTEVNNVPSGEGVLLKSENGSGTFIIPYADVDDWAADDNAFIQGTGGAVATEDGVGGYNYILSKVGGVVGFYYANGRNVATNRAYINTTYGGPDSPELTMVFHDGTEEGSETDGINKVNTLVETGVRYNLAGQRVGNDYKGIVIVNGRKVVIK